MYRCQTCRARTEDIDEVPCKTKDHPFKPQYIQTLHKFVYDERNRPTVLCTGNPPRPGVMGLGGNYGINCIRCRTKMKEELLSSRDSGVPGGDSTQTDQADTLPAEE